MSWFVDNKNTQRDVENNTIDKNDSPNNVIVMWLNFVVGTVERRGLAFHCSPLKVIKVTSLSVYLMACLCKERVKSTHKDKKIPRL